jgi:hypothetical protein
MVAADDEVAAAVVLPDDRVPDGLARTGHAHGQRQQRERDRVARIPIEHRLVAADAGVVIDVPRPGHPHHRVDQQVRLGLPGGPQRQLLVRPVERIPRLERHHAAPAQAAELGP